MKTFSKKSSAAILKHYGNKYATNNGLTYDGFAIGLHHFTAPDGSAVAMSQHTLITDPSTHKK